MGRYSFLIITFVLFLSSPFYGQRPNTKKVAFKYIQPPEFPLPSNVKTYHSQVNNYSTRVSTLNNIMPERIISIDGYERASSLSEADLLIKFSINNASSINSVQKVNYKEKINDSTYVDKVGGIYIVESTINISMFIKDVLNDRILSSKDGINRNQKFTSQRYSTYAAAIAARKANALSDATRAYHALYSTSISSFISSINSDFGYPVKKTSQPIARGKGKKHDYSDLNKAFNQFSSTLEKYDGSNLTPEIELGVLNCIDIWNKAILEYVPKKRKARIGDKIIGELYFNLAYAHFILRDWENVYKKLSKANESKGLKRLTKNFDFKTKNLEKRFKSNVVTERPEL